MVSGRHRHACTRPLLRIGLGGGAAAAAVVAVAAPADGLYVALSPAEYGSAAACGSYLEVSGPDGSVRVEVVDQCPPCAAGRRGRGRHDRAAVGGSRLG